MFLMSTNSQLYRLRQIVLDVFKIWKSNVPVRLVYNIILVRSEAEYETDTIFKGIAWNN